MQKEFKYVYVYKFEMKTCLFIYLFNIFLAFSGFIDRIAVECDRKQGKRGGVTVESGSTAEPRYMGRALPTELSGAPKTCLSDFMD